MVLCAHNAVAVGLVLFFPHNFPCYLNSELNISAFIILIYVTKFFYFFFCRFVDVSLLASDYSDLANEVWMDAKQFNRRRITRPAIKMFYLCSVRRLYSVGYSYNRANSSIDSKRHLCTEPKLRIMCECTRNGVHKIWHIHK